MMDIFEVGTGGGSVARVKEGALRVGPQSAGALPGPACYGLGGKEPTVTDANLLLGRLGRDRFLGGEMRLDMEAAKTALIERVAKPLHMDATAAAHGILQIAATAMSYAVKGVTTERGLDAADFALVAYGGAGPLHAVDIAREIGIRDVIIPTAPGMFSAFGMLFADLRYDFVRTCFTRLEDARFDEIEAVYTELEAEGRAAITSASVKPRRTIVNRAADMRYVGQEHAVTVDLPLRFFDRRDGAAIKRAFDAMHARRYGTAAPEEPAEIVSLRSSVTGILRKPTLQKIERGTRTPGKAASRGRRQVYFDGTFRPTAIYDRAALRAGNRIVGPAVIEEHASTTVLAPGDRLEVDAYGNLLIEVRARRAARA
jgi:N-methylhydantoinase A